LNKNLRIPVTRSLWEEWRDNPWGSLYKKLFRFYKFRVRKYSAADGDTTAFIVDSLKALFAQSGTASTMIKMANETLVELTEDSTKCSDRLYLWQNIWITDFGHDWYCENIGPLEANAVPCYNNSISDPCESSEGGFPGWAIALLIIGLVGCCGVIIAIILYRKWKKSKKGGYESL